MRNVMSPNMMARPVEVVMAVYLLSVAVLFAFDETALAAPVYAEWHKLGQIYWGTVVGAAAALHLGAIWLNGRAPSLSLPIRIAALFVHMVIALEFAFMFMIGGAIWGALTFGILVPGMIAIIAHRVLWQLEVWEFGH